jgi:hypothetical protein
MTDLKRTINYPFAQQRQKIGLPLVLLCSLVFHLYIYKLLTENFCVLSFIFEIFIVIKVQLFEL